MLHRSLAIAAVVFAALGTAELVYAQVPPAPVVVQPTPKQSKYEKLATRTGTLQRRTELPIQVAEGEGVVASVVRLEDLTAHETVLAVQIGLSEGRGVAIISEEELPDLKDSVQYIVQNMASLNEATDYIRIEYRTLAGASIGYMVHFATDTGGEWPPTAYVHVPASPYFPQSGGITRLTIQGLNKIVTDAQEMMTNLRPHPEKK